MSRPETDALKPLANYDGGPVFEEPWQAQVLALAFNLVETGHFDATAWSEALGAELELARQRGEPDTATTYYQCVLRTLEEQLEATPGVGGQALEQRTGEWRAAYLRTPHGQPVTLD